VFQTVAPEPEDAPEDHEDITAIAVIDLDTGARATLGEGRTPVWTSTVRTPDYGRLPAEASQPTSAGLVHRTYLLALNRPVDPVGLSYWSRRLTAGLPAERMVALISTSAEYQRRFSGLDATTFVSRLYTDGLRRNADPSGLAFWSGRIDHGTSTRAAVLLGFARSRELMARIATAPRA
jgi:hypothetical protein